MSLFQACPSPCLPPSLPAFFPRSLPFAPWQGIEVLRHSIHQEKERQGSSVLLNAMRAQLHRSRVSVELAGEGEWEAGKLLGLLEAVPFASAMQVGGVVMRQSGAYCARC